MEGVFCGANKDAFLFLQAIRFWMTDSCVIVMKAHEGRNSSRITTTRLVKNVLRAFLKTLK